MSSGKWLIAEGAPTCTYVCSNCSVADIFPRRSNSCSVDAAICRINPLIICPIAIA